MSTCAYCKCVSVCMFLISHGLMITLVKIWWRLWLAATVGSRYPITSSRVCLGQLGPFKHCLSICPSTSYSNLFANNPLPRFTPPPVFSPSLTHPSTISPSHSPCSPLLPRIIHFFSRDEPLGKDRIFHAFNHTTF